MSTFALDTVTGDLVIEKNNFVVLTRSDEVLQNLRTRLRLYFGEWFLDTTIGIPYLQQIFVKGVRLNEIESIFKSEIMATPGMLELKAFSVDYTNSNRNLLVSFKGRCSDGILEFSEVI